MKTKPLHLTIPEPCRQSFEEMPDAGKGKYCGKCEYVIYDFSQFTDAELFRFFEANPSGACGRFHNSQLNRDIELITVKGSFFEPFAKLAASIIAILTFRSSPAYAQGTSNYAVVKSPSAKTSVSPSASDPVTIKGIVTDFHNNPLQNAVVKFADLNVTTTDANGTYSFQLSDIDKAYNIYFTRPNYVATVRTFHPAMGNTEFNVSMGERDSNALVYSMGIAPPPFKFDEPDLPYFKFKAGIARLSLDHKAMLHIVANKLKANPYANVLIVSFMSEHQRVKIAERRAELLKEFLINQEGISEGRMSIEIQETPTSPNLVQFQNN